MELFYFLCIYLQTEEMLVAAESICGEYVWGVYDLLVLPPSFPFGGMENPCLTFVTPTVLVSMLHFSNLLIICI
jgi:leukotriene-A4 hydrolase